MIEMDQRRWNATLAFVGAVAAMTGVQLIAPALPVMKEALDLTEFEVSLIMSVYLLPAALLAIPSGLLADWLGRRLVFGWSLVGFGVVGLILPFAADSFSLFLGLRFVQGAFFAGLLSLTVTILGDTFGGNELVRVQGQRSVAMNIGDALLPILGGLAVTLAWQVPWFGQGFAVLVGIAVLLRLAVPQSHATMSGTKIDFRGLTGLFKLPSVWVLEYTSFLRLFLKFAILTFLPLYLVEQRGLSPSFAGIVIGIAAASGTVAALAAARIGAHGPPTLWIGVGVFTMGVALTGIVILPSTPAIVGASIVFGAGDGLMGVFSNALVASAAGPGERASFVAATGAIRNLAKFIAPAAIGAASVVAGGTVAFLFLAVLTCLSALAAPVMKPLDRRLAAMAERTLT